MQEAELKAYQGLKKQGAVLLKSRKYGLLLFATKPPNFTVTTPFRVPVTAYEYQNRYRYKPEHYQGSRILEQKEQLSKQGWISNEISDIIIFQRN